MDSSKSPTGNAPSSTTPHSSDFDVSASSDGREYIYPGGNHTRFEHSLGVMHVATRIYDAVVQRSRTLLESRLQYDDAGVHRDRQLVRFAALLHDVGHAPFSHSSEELMPPRPNDCIKYRHEDYSAAIVRRCLKTAIENHPFNENVGLTAEEIASLLEGTTTARRAIFWRELIDGQIDADRMDYLLRDSIHLGVQYGRFDLDRIVSTIVAAEVREETRRVHRLAVSAGGLHAGRQPSYLPATSCSRRCTSTRLASLTTPTCGWHSPTYSPTVFFHLLKIPSRNISSGTTGAFWAR